VKKDRTTARQQSSSKRRTTESQDAKSRKCRECCGPSAPCGTKRIAELDARICLCRMLNVTLNNTHPALQDREQWHQHFFGTATLRRTVCVSRMTYFFWRKNSTAQLRFGCQWGYHRVWIVRLPIALVDFSRVDLLFVVRYF
jgi:hypothetical protein